MNRTELINFLVQQRHSKHYLEITVHDERQNFALIQCAHKVSTFPDSSDDFFSQNQQVFDLVFIDGIHTEEQVLKDIQNARHSLAEGGILVLHDCMPPDEWHQRESKDFKEGENWNGTVWKAVLRVFNESDYLCTLLDTDWGCGIIDTAKTQHPVRRDLPAVLHYGSHYPWLLEYRSSIATFVREYVQVFYHLACMGHWQQVCMEQLHQLQHNGFRSINMTVLGTEEDLQFVQTTCYGLHLENSIIFHDLVFTNFERPAFLAMEEYVQQHEGYVLYLHSKGVSNPVDATKTKWRHLMMRELVDKWEACMPQLLRCDVIGVNWRDMPPTSHFCGNFWYASTSYLRTLADFHTYYEHPRFNIGDRVDFKRLGCEFWISSGQEVPRVISLAYRNVDFCNPAFWADK